VDPSSLLTQLRDAHAPEQIGLWPLASGWWLVIILVVIVITTMIIFSLKKWRSTVWKRELKAEFFRLRDSYLTQASETKLIALNQLMKQALSTARNTREYMHYTDKQWAEALNSIVIKGEPVLCSDEVALLSKGIYQTHINPLDASAFQRIERWLKHLS
jgi:type VI protein secretion system component VasK